MLQSYRASNSSPTLHADVVHRTDMSAYTTPSSNYPPPLGPPHPQHPGIPLSVRNPGGVQSDPLGAHHGLHVAQPYQYDPQPSQQSPYNNNPNPATTSNPDAENIQYQSAQYQGPSVPAPTAGDVQKANRLRKACDSCSVRKVKVRLPGLHWRNWALTEVLTVCPYSVTSLARHAELA
jgi:hypothetical protein